MLSRKNDEYVTFKIIVLLAAAAFVSTGCDAFNTPQYYRNIAGLTQRQQKQYLPQYSRGDISLSMGIQSFIKQNVLRKQEDVSNEQFTSVLDEARAMLSISDMVYAYTGIRRIARESGDKELQTKLEFPQKSGTLVPLIWENLNLYFAAKYKTKSGEEISSEDSEFI